MAINVVEQQVKYTVQDFEATDSLGSFPWSFQVERPVLLPSWGAAQRDWHLRAWYRNPYNWLAQGAFAALIKRVVSTPYEIKGTDDNSLTDYFDDVIANAQFGDYGGGWSGFIERLLLDFLTLDFGGVTEIIGPGDPMGELTGQAVGLAHLDSLRCVATGNPEYPIIYWARKTNKMHRLHHTRVARLTDMPDGDEAYYGLGLSALSRMISIVDSQVKVAKYIGQKLDDLPPDGLLTIEGLTKDMWRDFRTRFEADLKRDGADIFASTMVLIPPDPAIKVTATFIPFASTPDAFSYREYVEIQVNAAALTLGVDPQDIWPLTGAPLGTGTQSQILHSKARGKMLGYIYAKLERFLNRWVLPEPLEFKFKFEDAEADKERAEVAQAHIVAAEKLATLHSKEVALRYLADNVESFRDVLLDESGELIALPSNDPKAENQTQLPETTTAEDTTPPAPATNGAAPAPAMAVGKSVAGLRDTTGRKDIQAVRLDFESDFEDALKAAQSGDMDSRRFDTVTRALIRRHGQSAYEEGLKAGGVDEPPDDDDLTKIAELVAEQTSYITDLTTSIYDGDVSDTQIEGKPEMWFNKSVYPFFVEGQVSADKNGMYEFVGDDGEESCETCQVLKGQVHRLKDWMRKELVPKVHGHNFVCGGFRCKHTIQKTTGRASGGWV